MLGFVVCCFTSTETVRRLISDGSPDGHLVFHTPPGLSVRIETELFLFPVLTENVAGPVACPRMLRTRFVYYYG